jgi:ACR3 family arsenite efflux pump ArsB
MVLEIFALVVLAVLIAAAIWLLVMIGNIPGNMARAVDHPQTEAINILAWIGLLTMGLGWFIAVVWAKTRPILPTEAMERRIAELETKLEQMEVGS